MDIATVEPHHVGVLLIDCQFVETLPPGRYAFWQNMAQVKFVQEQLHRERSVEFGLKVVAVGVRDIILPGDMKDLMKRVTEAKKAAEANLIVRREETAAMRNQAKPAKLTSQAARS